MTPDDNLKAFPRSVTPIFEETARRWLLERGETPWEYKAHYVTYEDDGDIEGGNVSKAVYERRIKGASHIPPQMVGALHATLATYNVSADITVEESDIVMRVDKKCYEDNLRPVLQQVSAIEAIKPDPVISGTRHSVDEQPLGVTSAISLFNRMAQRWLFNTRWDNTGAVNKDWRSSYTGVYQCVVPGKADVAAPYREAIKEELGKIGITNLSIDTPGNDLIIQINPQDYIKHLRPYMKAIRQEGPTP